MYYRLGRLFLYTYLRLRNGLRFHGLDNVPGGPVILACNHASYMDPVLISLAFPEPGRRVRWMAWDMLFRVPVLSFLIRRLGAFPVVPDGADRSAFTGAVGILREGGIVGIFPEAGRTPDGTFQAAKPGFARLAARAAASVVPVVIQGSFKAWPRNKMLPGPGQLNVHFLPPIYDGRTQLDRSAQYELCLELEAVQKGLCCDGPAHSPEGA